MKSVKGEGDHDDKSDGNGGDDNGNGDKTPDLASSNAGTKPSLATTISQKAQGKMPVRHPLNEKERSFAPPGESQSSGYLSTAEDRVRAVDGESYKPANAQHRSVAGYPNFPYTRS